MPHLTGALVTTIPSEFEGPGGGYSPEDFYALALLNCFGATFKVIDIIFKVESFGGRVVDLAGDGQTVANLETALAKLEVTPLGKSGEPSPLLAVVTTYARMVAVMNAEFLLTPAAAHTLQQTSP